MTSPSSLQLLHPYTWDSSSNVVFEGYRSYINHDNALSKCSLIGGVCLNTIKAVGYTFAAIPQCLFYCCTRSVSNWTHARIYASLTWICIKALFNFEKTMEDLRLLEAYCYFDLQVNRDGFADIELEGQDDIFSGRFMLKCYQELSDEMKTKFLTNLLDYLKSEEAEKKSLHLTPVFSFLRKIRVPDVEEEDTSLRKQAFEYYQKLVEKQGRVFVIDEMQSFGEKTESVYMHPSSPALDDVLYTKDEEGIRHANKLGFSYQVTSELRTILEKDEKHWETNEIAYHVYNEYLVDLCQFKAEPKVKAYLIKAYSQWMSNTDRLVLLRDYVTLLTVAKEIDHADFKADMLKASTMTSDCILSNKKDRVLVVNLENVVKLNNLSPDPQLISAMLLYYLSLMEKSLDADVWKDFFSKYMDQMIDALFSPTTTLNVYPAFYRLLTINIANQNWDALKKLCALCKANESRFLVSFNEGALKQASDEFTKVWEETLLKTKMPADVLEALDSIRRFYTFPNKPNEHIPMLPVLEQIPTLLSQL